MLKLGCAISDKVSPKLCRAIKLDFQKINSALASARFALMASKLGLTLWELLVSTRIDRHPIWVRHGIQDERRSWRVEYDGIGVVSRNEGSRMVASGTFETCRDDVL
jgi:hypothetical protein